MIAWSIAYVLGIKKPKRITFDSITKTDLLKSIKEPREIDYNLVDAQKGRRVLDRIVGYELSPLLDKQLGQRNLSAGRVQSVVTRLIIDRENEIKKFMSGDLASFFKFKGTFFENNKSKSIITNLYNLESTTKDKLFKGDQAKIESEQESKNFLKKCMESKFIVNGIFEKTATRGPAPPFTTSTLQQDASRKLGFNVKRTMDAAQKLYEEGYITYMRTDSVNLSKDAMENIKKFVVEKYGANYYRAVEYKAKAKNVQEAHEAIRPTDAFTNNIIEKGKIGSDEIKLYMLIWKRTIGSQMKPAEYNVTSIQISISKDNKHFFMTEIQNLTFLGFLIAYGVTLNNNKIAEADEAGEDNEGEEDHDETSEINKNITIPKVGTELKVNNIQGTQEYNKPPSRYDEASLVKRLDPKDLNIGRPSTYATIINKIIMREYVKKTDLAGVEKDILTLTWAGSAKEINEEKGKITLGKEKNKFVPTHLGIMVTNFLIAYFSKIMDYKFTASMEDKLDEIAAGEIKWYKVMKEFYDEFHPLVLKVLQSKTIIEDKYTRVIGKDPETGIDIIATMGKYGPMIKICVSASKCKYAPIKEPLTIETITLDDALKLFEFPKELGKYEKKKVLLNKGQYGYYITVGESKDKLKFPVDDPDISLEDVIEKIKEKEKYKLGTFKGEGKLYEILEGPYGKYIKITDTKTKKKTNVKLPEGTDIATLTVDKIKEIITQSFRNRFKSKVKKDDTGGQDKSEKPKEQPKAARSTKKVIVKKPAVKKPAVKK